MKFVSSNQEKHIEKKHIDLQHSATSLFSKRVLRREKSGKVGTTNANAAPVWTVQNNQNNSRDKSAAHRNNMT